MTPLAHTSALLVVVGVVLAGCGGETPAHSASAIGEVPATASASTTTVPGSSPAPAPAPVALVTPVRLRIERLGVDAVVVPVSVLPAGDLDVPDDPRVLGWWSDGAGPAAGKGSVVLDGHVDSAKLGLGAFAALRSVEVGDTVEVFGAAGSVTQYTVFGRREYPKSSLPAAEVFSQDVGERLVLVTCGGRFDPATRHYDDNIVVYAVPAV